MPRWRREGSEKCPGGAAWEWLQPPKKAAGRQITMRKSQFPARSRSRFFRYKRGRLAKELKPFAWQDDSPTGLFVRQVVGCEVLGIDFSRNLRGGARLLRGAATTTGSDHGDAYNHE